MSALSILIQTLKLSQNIADGSPIPGIKLVIGTALMIAETAESVKQNKEECRELAARAAKLSLSVWDELRTSINSEKDPLDGKLIRRVATFQCALDDIQRFVKQCAKKSLFKRILKQAEIRAEIDRLTRALDDAVNTFNIQSLVSLDNNLAIARRDVSDIAADQQVLIRHAHDARNRDLALLRGNKKILSTISDLALEQSSYDGAFRLFGRDDLILEIDSESTGLLHEWNGSVQTFRARLRHDNRKVLVVRYCRADKFQLDVARLKKSWHPNVRPVLGYSRPDPVTSFLVSDAENTRPWEEVLMTVQGSTRIKFYLQALVQSYSAFSYLVRDLGFSWQRERTYASINRYPLSSDLLGNITYDIHQLWQYLPNGFILNPWSSHHKVHSYVYEDDLKQLVVPAYKRTPWSDDPYDDDTAYSNYLEQLYEQWLSIRAYCCTDTQWSLGAIPFPGDVFTGVKHHHNTHSYRLVHYPDLDSELDTEFPLLAQGILTVSPSSQFPEVYELNGWNRYTIPSLTAIDENEFPWHPGWHAYYGFGEDSPRREYDLGHVRLPVQQYLLDNIFSLSTKHGIDDPAKLCLVVTPTLYIDTRCSEYSSENSDGVWYLYIRSHPTREDRLDGSPWVYWSTENDDFPPGVLEGHGPCNAATLGGWSPRGGGIFTYRKDLEGYHEHQWTQQIGETAFEIGLRSRVEYVQLLKEEVLFMRELQEYRRRCTSDRIVEVPA